MSNHLDIGKLGEKLAVEYLLAHNYQILAVNYKHIIGEIDIISKTNEYTVFTEVKTRTSNFFGSPLEAITKKKQHQISKVALKYLKKNNITNAQTRFDVISITMIKNKAADIELITNAFESTYEF